MLVFGFRNRICQNENETLNEEIRSDEKIDSISQRHSNGCGKYDRRGWLGGGNIRRKARQGREDRIKYDSPWI